MGFSIEILGFISGFLGLSVSLPQLFKIIKAGESKGVSLLSWIISLANFVLWAVYGFRYDSFSQVVTNIIAALFTVLLVFVLIKQRSNVFYSTAATFSLLVVFVLAGTLATPLVLTFFLFSLVLLARIPQILASYFSFVRKELTNVSLLTYSLLIFSSVGWITYGVVTNLWHNIVASTFTLISSFIILFFETRKR